jgi:hypothetical protein
MFLNEEFMNLYEELSNLNEAKTGIPYKGYIICYGCHDTDRWYIKDSYENFLGTKSGYSTEKEAQEEIDDMVEDKNLSESITSIEDNNFIEDERVKTKPVYITNTLGQKVNLSNPEEFEAEVARQVERYKDSLVKSLAGDLTRKYRLKEIKKHFAGNQEDWFKAKVEYFENTLRNNFNLTVEREQ